MKDIIHRLADVILTDEWRYPILVGTVSIPLSVILYRLSTGAFVPIVVLIAGFVAGYIFSTRSVGSGQVGWRTGLVGGLVLSVFVPEFFQLRSDVAGSTFGVVFAYTAVAFVLILGVVIHGVAGAVGGVLGNHLAKKFKP